MSDNLGKPIQNAVDGENNSVVFDVAYPVRGDLQTILDEIRQRHGSDLYLVPLSGMSCGGGILQNTKPGKGSIVGLHFEAPANPGIRVGSCDELGAIGLDEIAIDTRSRTMCAGASVTLGQLNQALASEIGCQYRVLGADLTSYQYAGAGATFMTGGMGPQRRYFSDSVLEIAIYDGKGISKIEGEELQGLAATYGWTGIVTALRCRYVETPANEIAFAMPVSNTTEALSRLLDHLAPLAYLQQRAGKITTIRGSTDMVFGIEHVTTASMGPLLQNEPGSDAAKRGRHLAGLCERAGADGLVFVNGFSDRSTEDFLLSLVDDADADNYTIAGIGLEYTEVFNDPEEMRLLREAIPFAARTQSPTGKYVFKNHSDATVRLNPENVEKSMAMLWEVNQEYVARVEDCFASSPGVHGEVLVYGHLNPFGVDPHNRITFACDDKSRFDDVRAELLECLACYYRGLGAVCESTGSEFVGGEKGADSERKIIEAFGGPQHSPQRLKQKFARQQYAVASADAMFNWRALDPYCQPVDDPDSISSP